MSGQGRVHSTLIHLLAVCLCAVDSLATARGLPASCVLKKEKEKEKN